MGTRYRHTRERLEPIVAASISMAQVLKGVGLRLAGGNYSHMKGIIEGYGISTAHFKRQGWNAGKKFGPKRTPAEILTKRNPDQCRVHGSVLRPAMMAFGVEEKCAECGLAPEWRGKKLVFPVDHIDGDWGNNELENLRLLCPNCHSQTATFSGRGRKQKAYTAP